MRTIMLITNIIILASKKLFREKSERNLHQVGEQATKCESPTDFRNGKHSLFPGQNTWIWKISELPDGRFHLIINTEFTCINMLIYMHVCSWKEIERPHKGTRFVFLLSSVVACCETLCRSLCVKYLYVYKCDSDCVVSWLKCINNEYLGNTYFFHGSSCASVLPLRNIIMLKIYVFNKNICFVSLLTRKYSGYISGSLFGVCNL